MSALVASREIDRLAMRRAGRIAELQAEVDDLQRLLEAAPDWRPGRALLAQAAWLRGRLTDLGEFWERKLLVAIVGPSGAGKSTLLNALAGQVISRAGRQRPTTREVVAYVRAARDADDLAAQVGGDRLRVVPAPEAGGLEHLILVDTPDTNTIPENQALLARVLEQADLVLALFPAQNPRLQDNVSYLAPHIARLPADAVIPVLNMVDRVPPAELDDVVGDLADAVHATWGRPPGRVYRISARASAADGRFAADEEPLNALNEFPALQEMLFGTLNQARQRVDRRLAQAEHLLDGFRASVDEALEARAEARRCAEEALEALGVRLWRLLAETLERETAQEGAFWLQSSLYSLLARRWWGPIGWLIALWALLLRGAGLVSRLGRPGLLEVASPAAASVHEATWGAGPTARARALQGVVAETWPPIGDALVRAGFTPQLREADAWQEGLAALADRVSAQGERLYAGQVSGLAGTLSAWPLQALANLPTLGLLAWVAYETVSRFFAHAFLGADYLRHAALAIATVWLMSFALYQVLVAAALRGPLRRRIARELASAATGSAIAHVSAQLGALRALDSASRTPIQGAQHEP